MNTLERIPKEIRDRIAQLPESRIDSPEEIIGVINARLEAVKQDNRRYLLKITEQKRKRKRG